MLVLNVALVLSTFHLKHVCFQLAGRAGQDQAGQGDQEEGAETQLRGSPHIQAKIIQFIK